VRDKQRLGRLVNRRWTIPYERYTHYALSLQPSQPLQQETGAACGLAHYQHSGWKRATHGSWETL